MTDPNERARADQPPAQHPLVDPSSDQHLVDRVGARLLVIDPEDRVLLIEEAWSAGPEAPWRHWLTPGGGVEDGESLTAAATREVIEETGLRIELPDGARAVSVQKRRWDWHDVHYLQTDHIFAARVARPFLAVPAGATAMEEQTVVGSRWWSVAELRASDAVFVPSSIADLVERAAGDDTLSRPATRTAGRVLVVDPQRRVLLLHTRQSPGSTRTNWVAPGGGVEAEETVLDAAARELFEETGIEASFAADTAVVARERAVFRVGAWHLDQTDNYVVLRVAAQPDVDRSRWTQIERDTVLGWRWWTAPELRASAELYWPVDLPDVLDRIR